MNALLYLPCTARPFLRFVVGRRDDDIAQLDGLFRFDDFDERRGSSEEQAALKQAYAWFNLHIKVPPRQTFGATAGAACWFRNDAGEALVRMWELVTLLREMGHEIRFIGSNRPGTIVYYDEHQVVTRRPQPGRQRPWNWEVPLGRC